MTVDGLYHVTAITADPWTISRRSGGTLSR